mmetsp:Transcript_5638/g.7927  ORF Transcript_5638/g.7927 Transcript_5638/m.7927 type:complete len:89 (-) Transcript_5638:383-649(-)
MLGPEFAEANSHSETASQLDRQRSSSSSIGLIVVGYYPFAGSYSALFLSVLQISHAPAGTSMPLLAAVVVSGLSVLSPLMNSSALAPS